MKEKFRENNLMQFNYYQGEIKETKTKNGIHEMYSPKTSVVLLLDKTTGDWSRGVAICSNNDNFCKRTGRSIALSRAMKALHQKKTCPNMVMRDSRDHFLLPKLIQNKCAFMPTLSPREGDMLKKNWFREASRVKA